MNPIEEQTFSEQPEGSQPPLGPQNPPQFHQNYQEIESELSETVSPTVTLQYHKQQTFKFRLPQQHLNQNKQPPQVGPRTQTRQGRHGRILIDGAAPNPNTQQRSIKIFQLGEGQIEEKEEDLYEAIHNKTRPIQPINQSIPIRVTPILESNSDALENQSNSFLDVKEQPLIKNKAVPQPQFIKMEDNHSQTFIKPYIQVQPQPLILQPVPRTKRILDVSTNKIAPMQKGMFYEGTKQEVDFYEFQKVESRDSLKTGMDPSTSRGQFSSRNMLDSFSPDKKNRRLHSLKPVSQMLSRKEEKIYSLKTYDNLETLNRKQRRMKVLSNGKYALSKDEAEDRVAFIYKPIPFDKCLQSTITRHKKCSKVGYLDYDFQTKDGLYLLSCKKMPFHLGSNYHISLAKGQFTSASQFFVGKVQGNFLGSIFNVYTSTPGDSSSLQLEATICYSSQWFCCKVKGRKVQIYLRNRSFKLQELEGSSDNKNLKELYDITSNKTFKKVHKFVNKEPEWVPQRQIFALNFRGKVKYASVKNMIIINPDDQVEEGLLLAKKDSNQFSFDIQYPFTPLVAFAVAMTSFDFKLASQ